MFRSTKINKVKMSRLVARLFVVLALTGSVGAAQAEGWYVGANLGTARALDVSSDIGSNVLIDDRDSSWRIFGGYHYWDIMGFELGFTDLGKTSVQSTYMGSAYSDQDEAAVIDAVIVGTMRITGDISVLGKIGLLFFDADSETTSGGVTRTDSASGVDYTLGLGAKYDLGKQLGLRVEWQRFSEVGKGGGQSHYDVYSAGLVFDIK